MNIIEGLIGFMLLTTGSQLYWLFSGVVAFLVADFAAVKFFNVEPGTDLILIGLGAASIGILLTITARKFSLILAGFFAGLLAANVLPELFLWTPGFNEWILLVSAGLVGGLLVYFAYTVAVILLSALIGAQMLALTVHIGGVNPQVLFLAVLILGIVVQLLLAQYVPPSPES
jgi:hypothetical protein